MRSGRRQNAPELHERGSDLGGVPAGAIIHLKRTRSTPACRFTFSFSHTFMRMPTISTPDALLPQYLRITDHWRAVLPATNVAGNSLRGADRDQEGWTRRMLDFIGLPWDAKCLDFHQTDRVVITLSRWQVRQKIMRHPPDAGETTKNFWGRCRACWTLPRTADELGPPLASFWGRTRRSF